MSRSTSDREPAQGHAAIWPLALGFLAALILALTVARLLDLLGQRSLMQRSPWQPPEIVALASPLGEGTAAERVATEQVRLMGIVDGRAYFKAGQDVLALGSGERLPGGTGIARVERYSVSTTTGGSLSLFGAGSAQTGSALAASTPASVRAGCQLSASDRAQAVWIEAAVARQLTRERQAMERIFVPAAGVVRAQATAGMTSMFAIQDGDVLARADGQALTDAAAVQRLIIEPVAAGRAVVIEGERSGSPRRWVVASSLCRDHPDENPKR